jgi:hypothetical protein
MSSSSSDSFLIVFMNHSIRLSRILLRIKKFKEDEDKQTYILLWFVLIDFPHYILKKNKVYYRTFLISAAVTKPKRVAFAHTRAKPLLQNFFKIRGTKKGSI